jgi:hypothetical protein
MITGLLMLATQTASPASSNVMWLTEKCTALAANNADAPTVTDTQLDKSFCGAYLLGVAHLMAADNIAAGKPACLPEPIGSPQLLVAFTRYTRDRLVSIAGNTRDVREFIESNAAVVARDSFKKAFCQ